MLTSITALFGSAPQATSPLATCRDIKTAYQDSSCCGQSLEQVTNYIVSPPPPPPMAGPNPCAGTRPYDAMQPGDNYFQNTNCTLESGVIDVLEQAAANITAGYVGGMDVGGRAPILTPYWQNGLCPVNVHWHLGAEHLSAGEFDENGLGPEGHAHEAWGAENSRRLSGTTTPAGRQLTGNEIRPGNLCHHYDATDPMYTTPYDWQHCIDMQVGMTYEVHWPHSAAGACGTPNQYQTPFYDGVFCRPNVISLSPLNTFTTIGVQGQVFTIVNNESYYYPDLIRGMLVEGEYGQDIAKYTGSTTGTTRDNSVCSRYTPITWQVDRKCHLISASSFDKMCADMKAQRDDMSGDLYAHGSRTLVANHLVANNLHRRE